MISPFDAILSEPGGLWRGVCGFHFSRDVGVSFRATISGAPMAEIKVVSRLSA